MDLILFKNTTQALEIFDDPEYKADIHNYIISKINQGIIDKDEQITIFFYEEEDLYHIIFPVDYSKGLDRALEYYLEIENYEKCAEIKIIKNNLEIFLNEL